MNHLAITGQLVERSPLRYTPAGVAVLEFRLSHQESVEQAGLPRLIEFELAVVAIGDLARMWQSATTSQTLLVNGFLAPARKGSPRLVLHATDIRTHQTNLD